MCVFVCACGHMCVCVCVCVCVCSCVLVAMCVCVCVCVWCVLASVYLPMYVCHLASLSCCMHKNYVYIHLLVPFLYMYSFENQLHQWLTSGDTSVATPFSSSSCLPPPRSSPTQSGQLSFSHRLQDLRNELRTAK